MSENNAAHAPLHEGVLKGIFWGVMAAGAVVVIGSAIAGIAGAASAIGTLGSVSAAAAATETTLNSIMLANPAVTAVIGATNSLIMPAGLVIGGKTILDERHKYEQAHNRIDAVTSEHQGRVNSRFMQQEK